MGKFTNAVVEATLASIAATEAIRSASNPVTLYGANGNPVQPIKKTVPNTAPNFLTGSRHSNTSVEKLARNPYMYHSWTYAAINRIMQPISTLPKVLYKVDDEQDIIADHEVLKLFENPNPLMSGTDLWDFTLLGLLLPTAATPGGQVFWYMESGVKGKNFDPRSGKIPAEIWPYTDNVIKPRYNRNTRQFNGWEMVVGGNKIMEFDFGELIRIRLPNPSDPTKGLSPYAAAQIPVFQDLKSDELNTSFLTNYGAIGGLLTTENDTIDFEELRQYEEKWNEQYSGAGSAGKTIALAHGLKYEQFMRTNVDMQYMEQRKDNRLRIQAVYGVNEAEIGIFESGMNRATADAADRSVWQKTRIPLDSRIWSSINGKWIQYIAPGNLRGKSDKTNVGALREDYTAQIENAFKMWQMDVPAAEAFRVSAVPVDIVEYPWLTKRFVPTSLIDIEMLAEGYVAVPGSASNKPEKHLLSVLTAALRNKIASGEVPANTEIIKQLEHAAAKEGRKQRLDIWNEYVRVILDPGEKSMRAMFTRHNIKLRNEMLDNIDAWAKRQEKAVSDLRIRQFTVDPNEFLFDLSDADLQLIASYTPEAASQMKREKRKLKADYPGVIQWSVTEENIKKLVKTRIAKLQEVNSLTSDVSRKIVANITTQALEENWTAREYSRTLKTALQQTVDKMSAGRAMTFSRTETGSISSQSRNDAFKASDIREQEWLSAGDEMVRERHQIDGEKIVIGGTFSNDLRFPLDPGGTAGNVINCRCVALPVID